MNHKKFGPLSIALAALDPHCSGYGRTWPTKGEGREDEKNIEEVFAAVGILLLEFSLATKILFRLNFNGA